MCIVPRMFFLSRSSTESSDVDVVFCQKTCKRIVCRGLKKHFDDEKFWTLDISISDELIYVNMGLHDSIIRQ